MNTKRIKHLALRVINQVRADRRTLALILIMPIVLLTVAGVLINLEPDNLRVAIVNQDQGNGVIVLGDRLAKNFENVDMFTAISLSPEEAKKQLDNGDLDAVITIPATFSETALSSQEVNLAIEFEGSNPQIAEQLDRMFTQITAQGINSVASASSDQREFSTTIDKSYHNGGSEFDALDYMAPALIGVFVFLFVFILTSIAFLRERLDGTLERLRATPIRSAEIIVGYMMGFLVFALIQGIITLLFTIFVLDVNYSGNLLNVFVVETLLAITSVNVGIFLSTFARNEFQVLQFIPLVVVSQVFLGGVFWDVVDMPTWLQPIAYAMPLTHANIAMRDIMLTGASLIDVWPSLLALVAIIVVVIGLSTRTAARTI